MVAFTAPLTSCGGDSPTTPAPPLGQPPPPLPAAPVTMLAAGDIGQCDQPGPALTARLPDQLPGETTGAAGCFAYFEDLAGPAGDGFHSFVGGGWRVT